MRKRPSEGRHRSCQASKLVRNGCINDRYQVSKNRRLRLPSASWRLSNAARAALAIKGASPFSLEASACAWRDTICPQAKTTEKSVGIVARAAPRGQSAKLPDVAAADHRIIGPQRRPETFDDVSHMTSPFFVAVALQAVAADIVLVGALLVRQMADLHRLYCAPHDQGGAKARSQA